MNDEPSKARCRNGHSSKSERSEVAPINRLKKFNGFKKLSVANGKIPARDNGRSEKLVLITGGAGFIGTNLADRLLEQGERVLIFDNLSRAGVEQNLKWLQEKHRKRLQFQRASVLDRVALGKAVAKASHVFHFPAQVAVTTSLDNPIEDFEINARGTLNLLEAVRAQAVPPSLIFTSTNKVYGDLSEVKLRANNGRYEPVDPTLRESGFNEARALAFHSPYGCSKGAACQYVLDYARTFGLRTAVFRMSCIYGPHQFGTEDQGWVAHFLIKALNGAPITIYGDGQQVRDILFVEDLVDAFLLARRNIQKISGHAFNIGGGPQNTISLLELLKFIKEIRGEAMTADFSDWRTADQKYYVSNTEKFRAQTGWSPKVGAREGISKLYYWLQEFGPVRRKLTARSESLEGHSVTA